MGIKLGEALLDLLCYVIVVKTYFVMLQKSKFIHYIFKLKYILIVCEAFTLLLVV